MKRLFLLPLLAASVLSSAGVPPAPASGAAPIGEPVLGPPTLHSLGVHWVIGGDENQNAEVRVAWRTAGGPWTNALPLMRVEQGAQKPEKGPGSVEVPGGARLFAGSVLMLAPDSDYELKLSLVDPDGGSCEALLKARTIAEPAAPKDATVLHVTPGHGGGAGSSADPFRGLKTAQAKATPGTIFLLHAGTYPAEFVITKSGEPGRPIVWRAAGDGEAIIDGTAAAEGHAGRLISADTAHDVWFEGLTIRNGGKGIAGSGSARLVIRRCHISGVEYGIFATKNDADTMRGWFIADNVIEGPSTWPRTKGIENARGIQLTGEGHVICYNRIRGFADAIDTFPSKRCADIDFHNNEISEMTDDGLELDYSERNVRCFSNRFTNVYQGISTQPVFGGPIYVFRNALYNVVAEPFKTHNSPSGVLLFHNTVVKRGMPFFIMTDKAVRNTRTRNNLFIGTEANYAFESAAKMRDCDFDYDGFGGGPWKLFMKWNNARYTSLDETRLKAPVWKHAVLVDAPSAFASKAAPPQDENATQPAADLRLKAGSAAIDAGERLAGLNDDFAGQAPDLGAYEAGASLPQYGPRPELGGK
ncbi:MAG: hypothetical protein QOE70_2479 [Chthoniobacter sp.]|jgi:hypothetical protein|nr:hypothetical protein [Chthoniobacter sp.]